MKKVSLNERIEDYQSIFINKADGSPARYGKTVYISKKHHERIAQIVNIIGKREINMYDYIDSVLTEHFNKYHKEISISFDNSKLY
jgi:hypothetical protein